MGPPSVIRSLAVALFTTMLAGGCTDSTSTREPGDFGDTGALLNGGFNDTGVEGFAGQAVPTNWRYLFGQANFGDSSRLFCFTTGQCGVAGVTDRFGDIASASDSFGFVTTSNFLEDMDFDDSVDSVVVIRSGIASDTFDIPGSDSLEAARITFDYAFLTSRNSPATHQDSALVRVVAEGDTLPLLKVTTSDLQPGGTLSPLPGGCGQDSMTTVTTTYSLCTGWLAETVSVSPLRGKRASLEIVVDEVGGDTDQATALLFNNVKLEGAPAR
ncbi:MAG TPA: hypothetical protein VHR41_07615 [Gemmatimonadales bacterium]|jgi:hypothetical protein|nr:hypothetical protein [Gemmatimonadales bacterium]